jgi:hypothetical protein
MNIIRDLVNEFFEYCVANGYRCERRTGNIYKKVKPYAYEYNMTSKDFLNEIFLHSRRFHSNPNTMDLLTNYLRRYDSKVCKFLKFNKEWIGFSNGILNVRTCDFISDYDYNNDNIVVSKYINKQFTYSIETPLVNKILDDQLNNEDKEYILYYFGSMLTNNKQDQVLYINGETATGKTVLAEILNECVKDAIFVSGYYSKTFLRKASIVIRDELPPNSKVLSRLINDCDEKVVPLLYMGNGEMDDSRIKTIRFDNKVENVDGSLKKRIIQDELPSFIYRCIMTYKRISEME